MLAAPASAEGSYIVERARLSFRKLPGGFPAFGFRSFLRGQSGVLCDLNHRGVGGRGRIFFPVMLRAKAQEESGQDKTKRSFFLRGEDEKLPSLLFRARIHGARRLTWSDRYLRRMFTS